LRRRLSLAVLTGALAVAGCAAGPDYAPPAVEAGPAFHRAGEADAAMPSARWWEGLGDPQLSALVERGLRDAPTIAAAEARVRQARAGLAASRASLLPAVNASALYLRGELPDEALGGTSGSIDLFNLGFDAQWEADLWGGKQRAVERAQAQAGEASARLADAQVSLSAEIARTYVELRAREAGIGLLDRRDAAEARLVTIARSRLAGGTGTRQDLAMALEQAERTGAERAGVDAEASALRDALAVLTGAMPGTLDALAAGAVPLPPAQVSIGDPAAMLARRPDVMAAERRLAAATAGVGVERARRFPAVSLLGLIGIGGSSAGDVLDMSQISAIGLPRLSWSFLDFGRTAAAVRGAEAGRDAGLADYRASVLGALQDAESALARFGAARVGFSRAGQVAIHARERRRLDAMRAEAGTLPQAMALATQRQAVDAELAETQARARLALAYVALAKSLGLGWVPG